MFISDEEMNELCSYDQIHDKQISIRNVLFIQKPKKEIKIHFEVVLYSNEIRRHSSIIDNNNK